MPSDETKNNPLEPRRRRISAGSFRSGRSVISFSKNQFDVNTKLIKSVSFVSEKVDNNSRKISIIKNILGYQKSDLKENLASINPQVVMLRNLDEILKTLRDEKKLEDQNKESERKKREDEKRRLQESRLEKRFKTLKKVTEKIIAPVKGILNKIISGLISIVAGKFLIKLVDYLGDPKNQKKLESVSRFFTDFGPKLLTAYLLFGTRLGRSIGRLSGFLIRGAMRLGAASLLLLKKLGVKGAGGLARGLLGGKGRAIAGALQIGTAAAGFIGLERFLFGGKDEETQAFAGGGLVDGPYGSDRVNARLTDGEFVLSAPAVAAIGPSVLENINEKYGGSNKPRVVGGTLMAQEGGLIGPPDPTALTMMRLLGMGSRQGLQGTRGMGGRGLGGTLELGYHGTSQAAGRSIRQGGFLPGSRMNTFGTRNVFAAPTSNINTIPDAAQAFSQKGGSVGRGALERFGDTFRSADGAGDLIPLAMSQGSGPGTRLPFDAFGLSEMSTSPGKASKGARLVQNAMTRYPNSRKAQQLLTTGRTTARLGPLARFGRSLGRFIPGLNIGLGAAETAMRTAEGDTVGATLAAASMVPGPTGMAAAGGLILHDINKAFPTSSIRGRSGAQRAMMGRQNPSVAIPGPPDVGGGSPQIVVMDDSNTVDLNGSTGGSLQVTRPSRVSPSQDKMTTLGL
jgi:hypothetical protein|tara:strand:+ start:100 stop:2145 length:2046 start_codon:yes stop_codon:yes gene_type:complete